MFVDQVGIKVTAGKGGDGCVHFRREKYVPKGGPDGGDGGKGGNIIFEVVNNLHTLSSFRNTKKFQAQNGMPGSKSNRTGKNGEDLIIKIPQGTQIREKESKKLIIDMTTPKQKFILAQGGVGGKGNSGFVNSIRQAPRFAEKGDIGESYLLDLELKLIADIALVGYPNVGKSTFISSVSNARPKIANYHFTTLTPNLGICQIKDQELVFIDIPGLIAGASEGKGLGHTFLKHIQRAKYILHCIDIQSEDFLADFQVIKSELKNFSSELSQKDFFVVFTKIDTVEKSVREAKVKKFESTYKIKPFCVSSSTQEGMETLLKSLIEKKTKNAETEEEESPQEFVMLKASTKDKNDTTVEIKKDENGWNLYNSRLDRMARQTDWTNPEACERIYDVLKKWGVIQTLIKREAKAGESILISSHALTFRG